MSKTPSNRHNVIAPITAIVEYHSLLHNWMSTTLAMKRI